MAECLRCRHEFVPRKRGHVFCSATCRHRGARREGGPEPPSEEALARLFDENRDPEGRVEPSDWHPSPDWAELDSCDTLDQRRGWYVSLVEGGRL